MMKQTDERRFFVIGVLDPHQSLRLTYLENDEDMAHLLTKRLHQNYFNEHNESGFVFIETGFSGTQEPNERILQVNLDEEMI